MLEYLPLPSSRILKKFSKIYPGGEQMENLDEFTVVLVYTSSMSMKPIV